MAQDWSSSLLWFANYSNFCSLVTVLICFMLMVVFILRLNSDHFAFKSAVTVTQTIHEQSMVDIKNPFSLQLDGNKTSTLPAGSYYCISSLTKSSLWCYWGVDIETLYREFQRPWEVLLDDIEERNFLAGSHMFANEPVYLESCSGDSLFLSTPDIIKNAEMERAIRTKYPLVILNLTSRENDFNSESIKVVAMLSIFHLSDSLCTVNSYLLSQFLKTNRNKILNLQPLFIAASPSELSETESEPTLKLGAEGLSPNDGNECIICQNSPITMALLPCRHACVCNSCFEHLEKCPLCRGYIFSFFRIKKTVHHEDKNSHSDNTSSDMSQNTSDNHRLK